MNLLENTKRDDMVKDGWTVTMQENESNKKWVITNQKYKYRDYITKYRSWTTYGINELLRNLQIQVEMNRIRLPYKINVNTGMEGRRPRGEM